jgi:hypothetical protein
MKCAQCGKDMMIVGSKITSEPSSTDVFCVQEFACINRDCGAWAGQNLNNPLKSVKGVPIKMN